MTRDPLVEALRRRRIDLGLRQADVAEQLGINRASYVQVERSRIAPTVWNLRRIAEVLDCDLVLVPRSDWIVTDEMVGLEPVGCRKCTALRLTERGLSGSEIAQRLGITRRQVQRYRSVA